MVYIDLAKGILEIEFCLDQIKIYFSCLWPEFLLLLVSQRGFPSGSESACNGGVVGLIPGSGRSPGEGNGNPL